ncbi:uncharacterized protein LOC107263132 isoform X2 [Cephus cinctus]|nr:uncharacterized protein LOC107263132 isoform X2 [Cephus cinctus]
MKSTNGQWRIQLQIKDTDGIRHHFCFSSTSIENNMNIRAPVICRVQVKLQSGWNKLELDLGQLTRSTFHSVYEATQKLEISANCRLRRIYFLDKHYEDSEISTELCQGFLDFYMLKWGIHLVERSTQTDEINFKVSSLDPIVNVTDGVKKKLTKNCATRKECHTEFLQNDSTLNSKFINIIQVKSCRLIDNFFSKTPSKFSSVYDFKQKFKAKPYFTPIVCKSHSKELLAKKLFTTNLEKHWLSETYESFPKTVEGFFEKFCHTSIGDDYEPINKDQNEQNKKKQEKMQEQWIHRYVEQFELNSKDKDIDKRV